MTKVLNAFDGGANVAENFADDIVIKGNGNPTRGSIDGQSTVVLESTTGSITLDAKIDGQSDVALKAAGDVIIKGKIDGQSTVRVASTGGNIILQGKIDGQSTVMFSVPNIAPNDTAWIRIEDEINGQSYVRLIAHTNKIKDVSGGPAHGRDATTVKWSGFTLEHGAINAPAVLVPVPDTDPWPF